MRTTDQIIAMAGRRKEDFAVCMGCKVCASVCTINDLALDTNPQEFLLKLFMGDEIEADDALVRYCTSCYRCTAACPWQIRIPEVVRAFKEALDIASPFEKAFKGSVGIWGRVYEPYVFMKAAMFMIREGYLKYMPRWTEYVGFNLPHKVKRK